MCRGMSGIHGSSRNRRVLRPSIHHICFLEFASKMMNLTHVDGCLETRFLIILEGWRHVKPHFLHLEKIAKNLNFEIFDEFPKLLRFWKDNQIQSASKFSSLLIKFIFINSVNFMNIQSPANFKNFWSITKISFSIFPRWRHQSPLWSCDSVKASHVMYLKGYFQTKKIYKKVFYLF